MEDEPTCVKLRVKDMRSPSKLLIKYLAGQLTSPKAGGTEGKFDLTIYQSNKDSEPSKTIFDFKYLNKPTSISLYAKSDSGVNMRVFEKEIYMSFVSDTGCSIEITLKGEMMTKNAQIVEELKQFDDDEDIIPHDDPYYQEMLERKRGNRDRMIAQLFAEKQSNIYNHPMLKFYIEKQVTRRKEELDRERMKRKWFESIKWQKLREIKAKVQAAAFERMHHRKAVKRIILMTKIVQMFKLLSVVHKDRV